MKQHCLFSVTGAESDKSSILLVRLQRERGSYIWVHTVMIIKEGTEEAQVHSRVKLHWII